MPALARPHTIPHPLPAPTATTTVAPATSTALPANQTAPTPGAGGTRAAEMPAQPPHGVAGEDSIGDPYIPELGNTGYDVQHYTLALDLDPATEQLTATVSISATATLADLGRVSLDFIGYEVSAVRVGGQLATFYRSPKKLSVDLPQPLAMGAPLLIEVDYHGQMKPWPSTWAPAELGLRVQEGKRIEAFAEPDGARAWFPANDHPLDKATFRVEATVPIGLTAVSNGTLVATRPAGTKTTFIWTMDAPMATYLLTLAVGDYQRLDGPPFGDVTIRHYLFTHDVARASPFLSQTNEILAFLSKQIAPYPFGEFGHVEVDLRGLAMETQTMVMMDRGMLEKSIASRVMAHEAAHHWFGDSVSPATWADIWLNEGFATYFEALWSAHDGKSLEGTFGEMERVVLERANQENSPLDRPKPRLMFGANTYLKGAWVLHMLRQEIGDEAFFETLHRYYTRFAGGNARTADFQAVAAEVSGRDLTTFFQQWVFEPGEPNILASWVVLPTGDGTTVELQLCQQQPTPFVVPLDLSLSAPGNVRYESTVVDERQERLTVTLPFTPTNLTLDPDQHLLADTSINKVESLVPCK
ncbi:MAG: M1 family metallopeptidase [Ardenticatenaceae bacterium]|nr:M1 family metallopeptidase [Ardenticatenaceae bacterium]